MARELQQKHNNVLWSHIILHNITYLGDVLIQSDSVDEGRIKANGDIRCVWV